MEAIILKNNIYLVDDYDNIIIDIIVPARNIEKMKNIINCRIISKEITTLTYNHNAGQVFSVKIKVRFDKIKSYLNTKSIFGVENRKIYESLLINGTYYTNSNLLSDSVNLYAFGDFTPILNKTTANVIYYSKQGNKISLVKTEQNQYGDARYICFKNVWYSNRKF